MSKITRTRLHKPVAIDAILKNSFERLGLNAKVRGFAIMSNWNKIVGDKISNIATPAKTIGKTLYVTVSSSAWMEELKYLKTDMMDKINKILGADAISDIVFKLGHIDRVRVLKKQDSISRRSLTSEEKMTIDRLTSDLKDEELKGIIAGIIEKQKTILK